MVSSAMQRKGAASRLPQIHASRAWLAAGLLRIAWYLCGPPPTVGRIGQAMRRSDATTPESLIDRSNVRQAAPDEQAGKAPLHVRLRFRGR
jgi:hypothetical protein